LVVECRFKGECNIDSCVSRGQLCQTEFERLLESLIRYGLWDGQEAHTLNQAMKVAKLLEIDGDEFVNALSEEYDTYRDL
jgi:hypothetical protein